VEYKSTESLLGGAFDVEHHIDHSTVQSYSFSYLSYKNESMKMGTVRFKNFIVIKTRQPHTVMMALSKIGGLLVILKLTFILTLVHQYLFEKKLERELSLKATQHQLLSQPDDTFISGKPH
jgi:hypothetical protein